ncbi:MAG: hypothetical protein JW839_19675 [Candidatus Lokiarchaeota archaeon]|nr:hypothetical protein [Candidatus Lokiarchaeota archaeon]
MARPGGQVRAYFRARPSHGKLGAITIASFGVLLVFGLLIQALEARVLPSGYNVLHVEFAVTADQMDKIITSWIAMDVLHVEVLIDQLDVFMMPGWSTMFFGVQVLGLRALDALGVGERFRNASWKLVSFPLIAGAADTVENAIIFHVLSNPVTYVRALVPVLFAFVVAKWAMLFAGIVTGAIANVAALAVWSKRGFPIAPAIRT